MKIARAVLLAALLGLASLPAFAQGKPPPPKECGTLPTEVGGLAFAGDGDTIYLVGLKPSVRLWGVQAPELRSADKAESVAGMRARAAVEDLLERGGHRVECAPRKWDRYCRVVASCQAGGLDLSLELLRAGMAYGFWLADAAPGDTTMSLAYAMAEATARRTGVGLWREWAPR